MKYENFKDAKDREWQIAVTPWEQNVIKATLGVNVYDLVDLNLIAEESTEDEPVTLSSKLIKRFENDDMLLANIMWKVCESEATKREVDQRDFIQGCTGEALDRAYVALMGACANFFRRPEHRLVLEKITGALKAIQDLATEKRVAGIERTMSQFDPAKFVKEHTNSPQSQGSTQSPLPAEAPGDTRSEN